MSLHKEFTKRDVQRMRNLITGNQGNATQIQSGYEKNHVDRKEGDIFEENGKTWTIKNGVRQNITKMDTIKKLIVLPLICPNCKSPMKVNEYNKKMYGLHGVCFDCVIKKEDEIKISGKWQEYEESILKSNHKTYIDDLESALDAWYTETESHMGEDGVAENWVGGSKTKVYESVKAKLEEIKREED